jgi:hypothetical protein
MIKGLLKSNRGIIKINENVNFNREASETCFNLKPNEKMRDALGIGANPINEIWSELVLEVS